MIQTLIVLTAFPVGMGLFAAYIEADMINRNKYIDLQSHKRVRSALIGLVNIIISLIVNQYSNTNMLILWSFLYTHSIYWLLFDIYVNVNTGKKIFYTSYNTNNKETAYSDKIFNNVFKQYSGNFK